MTKKVWYVLLSRYSKWFDRHIVYILEKVIRILLITAFQLCLIELHMYILSLTESYDSSVYFFVFLPATRAEEGFGPPVDRVWSSFCLVLVSPAIVFVWASILALYKLCISFSCAPLWSQAGSCFLVPLWPDRSCIHMCVRYGYVYLLIWGYMNTDTVLHRNCIREDIELLDDTLPKFL